MQEQINIIDCYDTTAKAYADKFINELEQKHLDKLLLSAFAKENKTKGKFIDLGCGPGQTTKYLSDQGIEDLIGTDISPEMMRIAKEINPHLNFETANMLELNYPDGYFGSAIAFYSIVHFDLSQLQTALKEVKRVLKNGGEFLFSFHVGADIIHLDEFLNKSVNIDFHFFETKKVLEMVLENKFEIIDILERQPYKDAEHPSTRAYVWIKKV
ncbi:MAG: class I SAM-dependent methyltransferase [Bacteroidota bacterium]|nr:class I SAM-dependent methyltransferase [Bacteroidota bacterium]